MANLPSYIVGAFYRGMNGDWLQCAGYGRNGFWRFVDDQGFDDFADEHGRYNSGVQFLDADLRPYERIPAEKKRHP